MTSTHKLSTFSSGLRLVTVPMPSVKSITVLAMVGVGSRYESEKEAGIAHFLEHMVFKGTKNFPTAMDISSNIDGVGGQYNAFTGKDYTGYYTKVSSEHLDLGLDVISDMLLTPRLRDEDIKREKGVIIEEMNMYEDDPRRKVDDVYDRVIYGDSHLGRGIIGYKDTIRSFNSQDFQSFLDRWYNLKNVVVVIAGDADKLNGIEERVDSYFSKGEKRAGKGSVEYKTPKQSSPQLKIKYKDTEQAHFYLGFPSFGRDHKDRYTLSILATVLGGNSSARLFNEIREKRGLAYYAYASTARYRETGSLYAFEGVDPKKVDDAIKVTLEQFHDVSTDGIQESEVERAKSFIKGKLVLDWEDSQSMALLFAQRLLLSGKVQTPDEVLKEVEKITLTDVNRIAKKLIDPKKINLAVIGPYKNTPHFENLIK